MILYRILVAHYAPKDCHRSTEEYIVRENAEQVLDYILELGCRDEEDLAEEFDIYDADYKIIGTETLREKLLRLGGDYFDPDAERTDLYYGHTEFGWEEIKEVTPEEIEVLRTCDILLEEEEEEEEDGEEDEK